MQNSSTSITTRRYFITGSQRLSNFFWASLIFLGGAGFLLTGFFSFLSRGTPSVDLQTVGEEITKGNGNIEQTVVPEQGLPFLQEEALHQMRLQSEASPSPSVLQSETSPSPSVNGTYGTFAKEGLKKPKPSILPLAYSSTSSTSSIKFFPQGLIMCFYGCSALIFSLYLWLTIFWKVGNGFNEFNKETGVVRIFRWGLPGKDRQIDFSYYLKDIEALRVTLKEGISPRRTIALQIKGKGEIPLTRIGEPMALQDIENQASELANFLKIEIQVLSA